MRRKGIMMLLICLLSVSLTACLSVEEPAEDAQQENGAEEAAEEENAEETAAGDEEGTVEITIVTLWTRGRRNRARRQGRNLRLILKISASMIPYSWGIPTGGEICPWQSTAFWTNMTCQEKQ